MKSTSKSTNENMGKSVSESMSENINKSMRIIISPETNLVMDPIDCVISSEKSNENYNALLSILTETEHHIDGLVNSLSSGKPVLNSWKGRENTFEIAGLITNLFYGIIIGVLFITFILIIIGVIGLW
ncbi:MAG: tetrahydromethanopterin S-methyltransferase subunit B [Methanosarcinaceae archaeon]|nr:tetrahydromethanopterin S-methyltransferase subunit B [Methanosarcinaceae archaeon]